MKKYLTIIGLFFCSISIFAQDLKTDYTLKSKIFGKDRKISVYIPPQDEADKPNRSERYPVLYVFDGQFTPYSEMVRSMTNYYALSGEGIQAIVVGIHSDERWGEFVPEVENDTIVPNHGAEKLAAFLEKEVFPFVDSICPTTTFRIGVGHSLGGTFVLHEAFKQNPIFKAVIAVSPNLTMYDEFLVKQGGKLFQQQNISTRFIYTTVGSVANPEHFFALSLSHLDTLNQKSQNPTILWFCKHLYGEDHMTTFIPSFNAGYLALSSKLMLTDLAMAQFDADTSAIIPKIQQQLTIQNALLGEDQKMTTDYLVEVSKACMDFENYSDAMELAGYVKQELEAKAETTKEEKALLKKMNDRIAWCNYKILTKKALAFQRSGDVKAAAATYKKAFEIEDKRGTHVERIGAVAVFAEAGEIELAFEQLELLANYFELGGNRHFIDNPSCETLKKDPRWNKYMDKLEKNAKKYK